MDVERLVSSYNLIKSTDCSSLSGDTLQYYLVGHNIPCTAKFDADNCSGVDVKGSKETSA